MGEVATEGVVEAGEQLLGPVVVDQTRLTVFVLSHFFLPPIRQYERRMRKWWQECVIRKHRPCFVKWALV